MKVESRFTVQLFLKPYLLGTTERCEGVSVINLKLGGMTTLHMDIHGLGNITSSGAEVVGNLKVISVWLNGIYKLGKRQTYQHLYSGASHLF